MKIFSIFVLILILSFRSAVAAVDPQSYPTEFEFDVYEYYAETSDMLVALGERDAKEKTARMAVEKFEINIKDLENIDIKFSALESELLKRDSEYEKGKLTTFRWKKVKKLIDEIGWENIIKGDGNDRGTQ